MVSRGTWGRIGLRVWGGLLLTLAGLLTFRCSQAVVMTVGGIQDAAWESGAADSYRAPEDADQWDRLSAQSRYNDEVVRPIYRPLVELYQADLVVAIVALAISGVIVLWVSNTRYAPKHLASR